MELDQVILVLVTYLTAFSFFILSVYTGDPNRSWNEVEWQAQVLAMMQDPMMAMAMAVLESILRTSSSALENVSC